MKNYVTEIILDEIPVEIKSRTDERHPSGWSVIAFTPELSIRSTKLHREIGFESFAHAIMGACGLLEADVKIIDESYEKIQQAVREVTR